MCTRTKLTRANGQNVNRKEVGNFGRSVGQKVLRASSNHEDMGYAEDGNTPADELESTRLRISKPAEEHGQRVGKHAERLGHSVGGDGAHPQGAGGLLGIGRGGAPAVAPVGKRSVDKVADQGLDTVVRGTLAKLDDADKVGEGGNGARNAAQDGQLLFGRLALIVGLHDGRVMIGRVAVARRHVRLLLHVPHDDGRGTSRVVS